jgi:hypothetical protein
VRPRVTALATILAVGLLAASARASIYSQVLRSYEAHGAVPPCQFTSAQLETALKGIDTYGAQYFADFTNAVQGALRLRGAGACSPAPKQGAAPAAAPTRPAAGQPLTLGPVTAATGASIPAPMLVLAVLGAVAMLLGAAVAVAWWRGWSPRWAGAWSHAWSETGYRAEGLWSEFDDWLRSR